MKRRKLGNTGFEILPLALGGNVFRWTIADVTSFKILDAFIAAGFNFVDTADIYAKWVPGNKGGESETITGNWLKKRRKRSEVIVATKDGMEVAPDKKGLSAAYIFHALEDSLKRLRTAYIDLYQAHKDDPEIPLEETLGAFGKLMQEAKSEQSALGIIAGRVCCRRWKLARSVAACLPDVAA